MDTLPAAANDCLTPPGAMRAESALAGKLGTFFQGGLDAILLDMDGRQRTEAAPPAVLVAGAFDPVHEGHWGLAAAAARRAGGQTAFELCIANVDKPPLGAAAAMIRLRQFAWRAPVWVTKAPTFVEKARVFAGTIFAVGVDTAVRILAPRYYAQGQTGLDAAMAELRRQRCRFLVACRKDGSGNCLGLEDLQIAAEYRDLFMAIPRAEFRLDMSSTELRQRV